MLTDHEMRALREAATRDEDRSINWWEFGRAVEQAAYDAAIKACKAVDTISAAFYVEAIRALKEQPK